MSTTKSTMPRVVMAVAAALLLSTGFVHASEPDTSSEGPQQPPQLAAEDGFTEALVSLRIAGSVLRPREDDVSYTISGSGGCSYVTSGDSSSVWNTAITDLRQGARVDTLRMYFNDTSTSNSTAWFTVYDLYGSVVQEWSVSSSGSSGNSFTDSALIDHFVDYSVYSYALNWRPSVIGSTMQLCGFRIFYEP